MSNEVQLKEDDFDRYTDQTTGEVKNVKRFTWSNEKNMEVSIITYGATITSIKVPDKNGVVDDVVFGFDSMEGYLSPKNRYFGATVGRNANRIKNAQFTIDDKTYKLSANIGEHQLHGGIKGFDKVNWDYYIDGNKVVMSHFSPDKDEGYPGNLIVNVTFELVNNSFNIDYKAHTTKPTLVNLTNHSYFNLAGHSKGAQEIYKHAVRVVSEKISEVDENSIITGNLLDVFNTAFDLRLLKNLRESISKTPNSFGYDHNFCITQPMDNKNHFIAEVIHPPSGRILSVYSNQPGVQFYTSNKLPEQGQCDNQINGKEGQVYCKHGAFCLETQNYPDAINHMENSVQIEEEELDTFVDEYEVCRSVRRFTWTNENNVEVQVITYGATVTSIKVPNNKGIVEDITFGFETLDEYMEPENRYYGVTVGKKENWKKQNKSDFLSNLSEKQLNAEFRGFDKVNWDYHKDDTKVVMSHYFSDKEGGFPEDLIVSVTFELTFSNHFKVDFKAFSKRPTIVSLTNLLYFNLAGHGKGAEELYKHVVSIDADKITDAKGKDTSVTGTVFDLRSPTILGDRINNIPNNSGYDHNFCTAPCNDDMKNNLMARVVHPPSGRVLKVCSNQHNVQFTTCNNFPEKEKCDKMAIKEGKEDQFYFKHGGFCFETQTNPDDIKLENLPSSTLFPRQIYHHTVVYKISLLN